MRLTVGKWLAGSGLAIAALGGVPAVLGAPVVAWGLLIAGLVVAMIGLAFALLGETPEERRKSNHERTVNRNALENERDRLKARLLQIEAELEKEGYWAEVATMYGDAKRQAVIAGNVATLEAERAEVKRRLPQIETELTTA